MNTEHLHLFTKVEDGLPDININLLAFNGEEFIGRYYELFSKAFYESIDGDIDKSITHWLDLSKLTTIERAVEFAKDAFEAGERKGMEDCMNPIEPNFTDYIQQNKNKL